MKSKNFDYDEISDSIIISRKQEGEQVQGSAEIGNLILDFAHDGKILNIEFQGISKFLEMMNMNSSILGELIGADLIVQKQKGAVMIFAVLQTPKLKQPVPLAMIPTRTLTSSV